MSVNSEMDSKTLSALFKEGLNLYNNLGKQDEPTNGPAVQSNIIKCIKIFEDSTRMVTLSGLFSTNETIDELPTADVQYLLLPALLGSLCLKLTSRDRKDVVSAADVYYKDFLQRCKDYGLTSYTCEEKKEEGQCSGSEIEKLQSMGDKRAQKIKLYEERKALEAKLGELKKVMENEHVDDEIKRDYYVTMIRSFINEAIEDLKSIETEKQILTYMRTLGPETDKPKQKRPPAPLKPVIITKDAVQKAVFGAGYPSLPVMSVDEFYDKRVREGIFPDPNKPRTAAPRSLQERVLAGLEDDSDDETADREAKLEDDDPEMLEKLRKQDEFKDDHRRGWGNRANRS